MPLRRDQVLRSSALCLVMLGSLWCLDARAAEFKVPKSGEKPQSFAPRGWAVESTLEGDLDGDGKPDAVVVLLQQKEDEEGERARALLVLLKHENGYVPGGTNRGLLACFGCLGVKGGDGAPDLAIERGVLVVRQFGGSRESYGSVHRFRWNKTRARLELIGLDTGTTDTLTGESSDSSCNLLTGDCIETTTPPQVDENGKELDAKPKVTRKNVGKKPPRPLEDVKNGELDPPSLRAR